MDRKIVIRHMAGSKAGGVQEFPLGRHQEITIGRDDTCAVILDPDKDDLVSRIHARIAPDKTDPGRFLLTDLNSTNGTFLNNRRIVEPAALAHGDEVGLGASGPRFRFELDPPAGAPARTRVEPGGLSAPSTADETRMPPTFPSRAGMGRHTLELALDRLKGNMLKTMINGAAVLLAIVVLVVAVFTYRQQETAKAVQEAGSNAASAASQAAAVKQEIESAPSAITPADIYRDFAAATVFIESSWKLVSALDGRDICQLHISENPRQPNDRTGIYVALEDGSIEPWLITSQTIYCASDEKIGATGMGTGFVAHKDGYILTNSHVASAWLIPYDLPKRKHNRLCQFGNETIYKWLEDQVRRPDVERKLAELIAAKCPEMDAQRIPGNWIPEKSGQLGGKRVKGKLLKGLHNYLYVTFPGTDIRIEASPVNSSEVADVAQIKVNLPQALKPVKLSTEDGSVKAGDPIVVLGYPGLSPDIVASRLSQDPTKPGVVLSNIPNPTVTDGSVGKIISTTPSAPGKPERTFYSTFGDTYQLTVNATGHGNSGGPVFNSRGEVVGIFTYAWGEQGGGGRVSAAVPIKYGRELMNIQPVF